MASDQRTVTGKVHVASDSEAAVALDLARIVAATHDKSQSRDEEFWIRVYRRCYAATHGHSDIPPAKK